MPRAPEAADCDSPCLGIYGQISPLERSRQVIRKVEREKGRVALRKGEPLKTRTSRRGCFHLNAIIEGKRKIPRRCIFVRYMRYVCVVEVQWVNYRRCCSSSGAHDLEG